mmetsp:Transcript_2285/g.6737  ORF Transcript_2285/g.6737 Transcript_2285/m.6737 type:complete len:96 (-) Transcript_2285:489-776(-)
MLITNQLRTRRSMWICRRRSYPMHPYPNAMLTLPKKKLRSRLLKQKRQQMTPAKWPYINLSFRQWNRARRTKLKTLQHRQKQQLRYTYARSVCSP